VVQTKLAHRASRRADRVIAVSKFVRDFLVEDWRIDPGKIALIYHGTESQESCGPGERPPCIPDGWRGRFIFSAGSVRPARGLEDLINAIIIGHHSGRDWPSVVVAGGVVRSMTKYQEKLIDVLRQASVEDRLIWAGSLNDMQMTWCYRNCQAFVMTSRIEACPNIAMESLAQSAVNVAADNPPLPEFFQSLAIYYKSGDAESLVVALEKALSISGAERVQRLREGQARAKDFSWDIAASRTIETLMRVSTSENCR
jgi:glycosyltransferase involved in cell wall biosynthesis